MKYSFTGLLACSCLLSCVVATKTTPTMNVYALRLHPGQDLKHELDAFAKAQHLQAGFVITCVGICAKLRFAQLTKKNPYYAKRSMKLFRSWVHFRQMAHICISPCPTARGQLLVGTYWKGMRFIPRLKS